MCGIIAVVRRRSRRAVPTSSAIRALADAVLAVDARVETEGSVEQLADALEALDRELAGVAGVSALMADDQLPTLISHTMELAELRIGEYERAIDGLGVDGASVEGRNAALLRAKDAAWAVGRDRLRTAVAVADLCQAATLPAAVEAYNSVQLALSALDRLEVRGRDSAGLHLLVRGHGLDPAGAELRAALTTRGGDPTFGTGSVRIADGLLSFVYKAAAEIGELGDNTRFLRDAIRSDELLRRAVSADTAEVVVFGHTRWASVGIISEPNAHPLNSELVRGDELPYTVAALNGDVDNFADLKVSHDLSIHPTITTDAKVIPTIFGQMLAAGVHPDDAFRRTVVQLDGSVAIVAQAAQRPEHLYLALRGSGQGIYVGLAEDAFVVASEPYGVVEQTNRYLRMDGETLGNPANPASRGQLVVLNGALAGEVAGIRRIAYDGTELAVATEDLATAEVTTRDIDRGDHPHYLLKEIAESPTSFRKTLRGRLVTRDGRLTVELADSSLPADVRARLADGTIRRIAVIGQGTAAVAGEAVAHALDRELAGALRVEALPATELSGFALRSDMSDTLVVAISQSGTTTDTNRTVDLVRARGGAVIAIVNRRGSDLADKADGVLYTSDGRDVEMSVASTKAFYSQVAAGMLLAVAVSDEVVGEPSGGAAARRGSLLAALRDLPDAMEQVLAERPAIAAAAAQFAPARRYWAIVGNGANRVAAREIRIKLSELCYKSIACDATEDKKHIDLSSEPLVLVCAAGLSGSTAADVAKEVAIYRAHKAAPIVVAEAGASFPAALAVLTVPAVHSELGFVLSAVVGHLFGYEAALAIDAQARPLRETRAAIEGQLAVAPSTTGEALMDHLRAVITLHGRRFLDGVRRGDYNGHLEAATAVRLASLYRYAMGVIPLDAYQVDHGKVGTPAVVLEDLAGALTQGIEELTRPVDAIKHQAKTVTVGISRSEEGLLELGLVRAVLDAGTGRDALSYTTIRTLAALDPAVAEVVGFTRYDIEGDVEGDDATISIADRGGIARDLVSRVDRDPRLRGSKHRVAVRRTVVVTTGRRDGRTIVLVPEVKDKQAVGITLLHVRLHETIAAPVAKTVLEGYANRLATLMDEVLETEPTFREDLLATVPVVDLLTEPATTLANRWRG
jgi:glucosamine--fructose-6-phosphate aminotransferase (isomerizing)